MSKKRKLVLRIDLSDWEDEVNDDETIIHNEDELIEQLLAGHHPAEISRAFIVSRERLQMDEMTERIMPPNKLVLQSGAQRYLSEYVSSKKIEASDAQGNEIRVRQFVGTVGRPSAEGYEGYVDYTDPRAVNRAQSYLRKTVMGNIKSRLNLIYVNGGDVAGAVDEIKRGLEEMLDQLVEKVKA